jgi:transcriptional regulator with XRE-family HTH domain
MSKRHPILVAFGSNVRRRRETQDLTQDQLAEKADLDQTYISGIERGIRNPGIKNVARIAKALGISTAKLVEAVDL